MKRAHEEFNGKAHCPQYENAPVPVYLDNKPAGDDAYAVASRVALWAYAKQIRVTNPALAEDIENWLSSSNLDKCR